MVQTPASQGCAVVVIRNCSFSDNVAAGVGVGDVTGAGVLVVLNGSTMTNADTAQCTTTVSVTGVTAWNNSGQGSLSLQFRTVSIS